MLTQRKPYLRTPEIHVLGKKHSAAFQPESYCLRAPTNTKPENSWTIFGHLSSGTWTTGGPEPSLFPSWALLKPHQQCWHSWEAMLCWKPSISWLSLGPFHIRDTRKTTEHAIKKSLLCRANARLVGSCFFRA